MEHQNSENPEESKNGEAPHWKRPRFEERKADRQKMVDQQIKARGVKSPDVLTAMENVPRHLFVPETNAKDTYGDYPIPIGDGQTISQPYIVAYMTEKLELQAGDRVLEIGTGSGYQAAVLSEITPYVFSTEINEELAETAEKRLRKLGYETIKVKHNEEGFPGWEEYAPFDAVIVTCAASHIPDPLKSQLKPGGRMIIPVGGAFGAQDLIRVTKDENGKISSEKLMAVRFVPMRGKSQENQ